MTARTRLRGVRRAFRQLVFQMTILPRHPYVHANGHALRGVSVLLNNRQRWFRPGFVARRTHRLNQRSMFLLATFGRRVRFLPFRGLHLAISLSPRAAIKRVLGNAQRRIAVFTNGYHKRHRLRTIQSTCLFTFCQCHGYTTGGGRIMRRPRRASSRNRRLN